tara:strand:- start:76 stop:657 length:582 start_codon:yes stop_codon:yes gene_type:complete
MIVHISGFPGSGKTTLGEKIQKIYGSKIIVYDTDHFIQHNNNNGKALLKVEKDMKTGKKTQKDYNTLWEKTIKESINKFIKIHTDKPIIFVGSLDNFAPIGANYSPPVDYKYILDVPLYEIMRRYYLRIYKTEQELTEKQADDYWKKITKGIYNISSSSDIIKNYDKYMQWHKKNNYKIMDSENIIKILKKNL